jgi:large subunit ribosomal protein L18
MDRQKVKQLRRRRRVSSIRRRVQGHPSQPRLVVYRSLKHMYVQVIDDLAGKTLASASTRDRSLTADKTGNVEAAQAVGKLIAERAKEQGISAVTFDRAGFRYHGRVKALADAAREGGLKF